MNESKMKEIVGLLKEDSRQSLTKISRKVSLPIVEAYNYVKEIKKGYNFTIIKKD